MLTIEAWRKVWRDGILPAVMERVGRFRRDVGLLALANALRTDDSRLLQGATTSPPPLAAVADWMCEGCDPVVLMHTAANGGKIEATMVGLAEKVFAITMARADELLGGDRLSAAFSNWWDDTPRHVARGALLAEIGFNLGFGPDPLGAADLFAPLCPADENRAECPF